SWAAISPHGASRTTPSTTRSPGASRCTSSLPRRTPSTSASTAFPSSAANRSTPRTPTSTRCPNSSGSPAMPASSWRSSGATRAAGSASLGCSRPEDRVVGLDRADAARRPVADGRGDSVRGFLHQRSPMRLHALGGRRERERGDQMSGVVADAGGDAAHADLRLLVVGGPALALGALEVALEKPEVGDGVLGVHGEAGALRVVAQTREAVVEQEQLAGGGDVHHAHRRATRRGALDVDDLVVMPYRKIGRFAGLGVQLAHQR